MPVQHIWMIRNKTTGLYASGTLKYQRDRGSSDTTFYHLAARFVKTPLTAKYWKSEAELGRHFEQLVRRKQKLERYNRTTNGAKYRYPDDFYEGCEIIQFSLTEDVAIEVSQYGK